MRVVTSREHRNSRSEFFKRCRLAAIHAASFLALAACGGGGGGGGGNDGGGDGGGGSGGGSSNAAPVVDAGADQTIELPVRSVELSGSATDDSSTTLTYSWSVTSGPEGVTFSAADSATTTATFPGAGNYVLTLSVSDGSATGTDSVAVTVNPAVYPASDTTNSEADHGWLRVAAADVGMDQALLEQAATYASTGGTADPENNAGMIVRHGRLVHSWGDIDRRFDMKSTTKSFGSIALGLAIDRGMLSLADAAQTHYPEVGANPPSNAATGWLGDITILQLATHTAGFIKTGGYTAPPPADPSTPTLIYQPGTTWFYSDGGLNWLAELLTAVYNQDLSAVLRDNVWATLGLNSSEGGAGGGSTSDVHWRDNQFRDQSGFAIHNRELASGIFANANAMARVGLLFLRNGVWADDQRILSEEFVSTVSTPPEEIASLANPNAANFPGATTNYGVLWWTNATGQLPNVPRDAYWAWGLGDSLIVVIPSLDIVAVRAGVQAPPNSSPGERVWNDDDWNGEYSVLAPFLDPIVQSIASE
jgi:CubicO group peptidase (beta-lactamase class C family)